MLKKTSSFMHTLKKNIVLNLQAKANLNDYHILMMDTTI